MLSPAVRPTSSVQFALELRFRDAVGVPPGDPERDAAITFAVEFSSLVARILTASDLSEDSRRLLRSAMLARTRLSNAAIDVLLDMVLAPENRVAIGDDELRAFAARFGREETERLRASVTQEIDLAGFAARYGPRVSLLLLEAMFQVCTADGRISRTEIGRLSAAAEQLDIDRIVVGALFRKWDPRSARGELKIALEHDRYAVGNAYRNELPIPDPSLAPVHCELLRTPSGWRVAARSTRPTLLNGRPISSSPMLPGDELRVGSLRMSFTAVPDELEIASRPVVSPLSVRGLTRNIGPVPLLDDVSFTAFPGEVIAVVGPSGSGKTTLLNAIAGIAPADEGEVLFDGEPFHRLLANDESIVGIVPQDDVVHADLTVEESLRYSARLRFSAWTPRRTLATEVDRVLNELEIEHIRRSRIGDAVRRGISGGQRKRVNLGQELLTRSTRVLFLDEPTSGLDPQTSQGIVSLVRQLADDGRVVFLVTHDVTPSILAMVDHLLVLAPGGRLAWFGPPAEACRYFEVRSVDEIFSKLPEKPGDQWGEAYRKSAARRKYVETREHFLELGWAPPLADERERVRRSWVQQYLTLASRYFRTKRRDWLGLAVLAAQAPILGLFMWIVFPAPDAPAMFMLSLSSLWFGASAAVRELIADRALWRREARLGLATVPYVASKVTVLGLLVAAQCTVLSAMCWALLPMNGEYGYSLPLLSLVSSLTGWIGMALGLLISASLSSSEAAVGTLPLVLIPQITFSGLIVKVKEMGAVAKAISWLMIVRYSFDATIKAGDQLTEPLNGGMLEREARPISGVLYNLGFKPTAGVEDVGIPLWTLITILAVILAALLAATTAQTARTRDGN